MNMGDRKFEVYRLTFDHADKEVGMLWQRNAGFMVANSAFLIIVGMVQNDSAFASLLSVLAFVLSVVWLHQNYYSSRWLLYWIRELKRLEKELPGCEIWTHAGSAEGIEQGRPSLRLTSHGLWLAAIFVATWICISVYFLLQAVEV